MARTALGHLKVLELTSMVTGPYCCKLLADLGAEVIKVEEPGRGDPARQRGPFLHDSPDKETSGLFLYLNTNKLSITLNMHSQAARHVFRELVRRCDVLVEDYPLSDACRLGITFEELSRINPRLVVTSISPYGRSGPYGEYRGRELNCVHAGGEGFMMPIESDFPDREPVRGGGLVGDCMCGLSACLATLAAAYRSRVTGKGQHVDVSKQDVLMTQVGLEVAMYTYSGTVRNRHRRAAITAVPLECRNGYVQLSAFGDRDWQSLIQFMGRDDWAKDEGFSDMARRWQRAEEINEGIQEWIRQYDKDYLFRELQSIAVSTAPVNTSEDLVKSPQLEARRFFVDIEHPVAGRLQYPSVAYRLSETPVKYARPAPLLGEHNRLVLGEQLGLSSENIRALAEVGTI